MRKRDENPVEINPDKETAERQDLHVLPGDQEDTETATARETRVERHQDPEDVTGRREPMRSRE